MRKSYYCVARHASNPMIPEYVLYVSDIIGNNGFSAHREDAMKFQEYQADTIKKALETIEKIHASAHAIVKNKVFYSIQET